MIPTFFAIRRPESGNGAETRTPASSTAFKMSGGPAESIAMTAAVGFSDSKPSEDNARTYPTFVFPTPPQERLVESTPTIRSERPRA